MTKKASNHTSIQGKDLVCFACGARLTIIPDGGIPVGTLTGAMRGFAEDHAHCQLTPTSPGVVLERNHLEWERGFHVGLSSATIFKVMEGRWPARMLDARPSTPSDPSDLGRCLRLLAVEPSYEEHLREVAAAYPAWAPLVANWGVLKATFVAEVGLLGEKGDKAPKTHALMKKLLS